MLQHEWDKVSSLYLCDHLLHNDSSCDDENYETMMLMVMLIKNVRDVQCWDKCGNMIDDSSNNEFIGITLG